MTVVFTEPKPAHWAPEGGPEVSGQAEGDGRVTVLTWGLFPVEPRVGLEDTHTLRQAGNARGEK